MRKFDHHHRIFGGGEVKMMESRIIEYPRPGGGLDYHSSPLIGEIPTSDYSYYRSIDQLRTTINEREVLQTIATSTPLHGATTAASTTDLRAIEFSHKSFMSTASERTSNDGEMHHQHQLHQQNNHHHHHHQHHENQSNKHQHHNNNHNLMDDRANNNVHNYTTTAGEIKTKSYRKNRKHNRNATANNSFNNHISSSLSTSSSVVASSLLQHQQQTSSNNNYHQTHQQIQPYQLQQTHQSTSNDQLSPHSHNADQQEASVDEMITGPVTGQQTKEMKVGVVVVYERKCFKKSIFYTHRLCISCICRRIVEKSGKIL